jgi:hypothetical protein
MAEGRIRFANNYNDLSTDEGFQFEVLCNRCGTGYRTRFKPTTISRVGEVLEGASGLLGGILGRAADVTDRVRSATWEKAHDKAFEESMRELEPDFIQCPRCSIWVCREACWNTKKGLCKECAPDLGVEMAAAQASKSVEEVWAHAKMSEEDKKLSESDWREGIRASCPNCEKPLATNAKFCPECGFKLKGATHCTQCGAKLGENAKFCAECGAKTG